MEKMTSQDSIIIEGTILDGKSKIFGLTRILEAFMANFHRIEYFWDLVVAHYVCISSAKNNILRTQGIENLNILIEKCFQHFCQRIEKGEQLGVKVLVSVIILLG
jgi:hypothetical protein